MKYIIVILLFIIINTSYSQGILITRQAAERCLEVKDSLEILKPIFNDQKILIGNQKQIILSKDTIITKLKSDSTEFVKVINNKTDIISNKDKEIEIKDVLYKENDNKHKKKELVLLLALVLSLLL